MTRAAAVLRRTASLMSLCLAAITACESGGSTTAPPGNNTTSSIVVSVAPAPLQVAVGQAITADAIVTRLNYTGAVTFTLENAPAGVTASFNPASISGGTNSSSMTITAASTAAPGTYTLTLRGTGQGVASATVTFALTIAQLAGTFTMTLDPAAFTLARNATDTFVVRFTRTNFTGPISVGAPAGQNGFTATVVPQIVSADSALVIISVGATATAGNYTIPVTGQGTVATRFANFTLTVSTTTPGGQALWSHISVGVVTCGLTRTGGAYCWGEGESLGTGNASELALRPMAVSGGRTWADIQAGAVHVCGVTTAGDAYCWGRGSKGQLGNGSTVNSSIPVPVSGGHKWITVTAGFEQSCGITVSRAAYCWGGATAPTGDSSVPVLVTGGLLWESISPSFLLTCGITTSNDQYCWAVLFQQPQLALGGHRWRSTSVGIVYVCAIRTDAVAMCQGNGYVGSLGNGSIADTQNWVAVSGGRTWASVSASTFVMPHTCGVTTTGEGFCWGNNQFGQLGTGDNTNRTTPAPVAGARTWTRISANGYSSCGVTVTGEAYCWGTRLGNGVGALSSIPVRVLDPQ